VAGKWTAMMREMRLDPMPIEGGEKYQVRINKAKTEFAGQTSTALAATFRRLRDERDALEETRSALDCRIKATEQLITDAYDAEGIEKVDLTGGVSVATEVEPYASTEDPEAVRAWAIERGLGGKMSLPWQTLNSEVKEMLLNGEAPPPGVKLFVRTKVALRGR